jgi:hypothetical protein
VEFADRLALPEIPAGRRTRGFPSAAQVVVHRSAGVPRMPLANEILGAAALRRPASPGPSSSRAAALIPGAMNMGGKQEIRTSAAAAPLGPSSPYPVRTTVGSDLLGGILVEIDFVAHKGR